MEQVRRFDEEEEPNQYKIIIVSRLGLFDVEVLVQASGIVKSAVRDNLLVAILWSPCCPYILHDGSCGEDHEVRDVRRHTNGTVNLKNRVRVMRRLRKQIAYLDTTLRLHFEVHVGGHVGEKQTRDTVPRPGLYPPRCDDEEQSSFDAPAPSGVRDDDHCHVDSETSVRRSAFAARDSQGPLTSAGRSH